VAEKVRQSNIELCRIASILLVMLVHSTGQSLGDEMGLDAHILKAFSIIGVNVFVMITGYFSATPKKISLLNLAFICLFWMIIKVGFRYEFGQPIGIKYAFFITTSNWFIVNYIGLLFFAPMLNSFCQTTSRSALQGGVLSLIAVEVWFDLLPPIPAVKLGTQDGYSVLSFMVLYLLARYIRLYGLPNWIKYYSPLIYIFCSLFIGIIAYMDKAMGLNGVGGIMFAYSNPIVILSSVAFLLMFERMSLHSKFINHIAKSTLAVLLGHSAIFFLYTKQFKYLYDNYSGIEVVVYWALAIAIVFVASILIDQLRLILWKPISNWLTIHIQNNNIF
jgi:hypothetical protein